MIRVIPRAEDSLNFEDVYLNQEKGSQFKTSKGTKTVDREVEKILKNKKKFVPAWANDKSLLPKKPPGKR